MGFEPTSENCQPEAHTCLSPHLNLASTGALGKAPESASPVFLIFPPQTNSGRPAWFVTSLQQFRHPSRNALPYIRQRVPVRYWQLLFTMCFTSPMAPRHATPDLYVPVEACRPLSGITIILPHLIVLFNTLFTSISLTP